ncbi:hypothetical protein MKJ04_01545 [Pontibacter sp. E15-1]|uniref:hypothetical protein n=1 Tax=Pontibacter sp. E15-1 TaxID=2919918 RepID=UPI001F4F7557|nr:hypothetical protein [Pontibacter sp. E15-1]MCJ8163506.1 hypothetical protein [Pontibacter sp. E15-1]
MIHFNWRRQLTVAFAFICLSSCEVMSDLELNLEPAPEAVTYLIPQGQHYATSNFYKKTTSSKLRFEVLFDSSAVYTTTDAANQGDINKLYGLSDCGGLHQVNSARFGWRWYQNKLEIHAYTYLNKQRQSKLIGTVALGKKSVCELEFLDQEYQFWLDGKMVKMPRACNGEGAGYQLYPYFGGDETAPHDVTIYIRDLE